MGRIFRVAADTDTGEIVGHVMREAQNMEVGSSDLHFVMGFTRLQVSTQEELGNRMSWNVRLVEEQTSQPIESWNAIDPLILMTSLYTLLDKVGRR